MLISELIENLSDFIRENGDLECYYAADDEGNEYHKLAYEPSLMCIDSFNEVRHYEEDYSEDEYQKICIIN